MTSNAQVHRSGDSMLEQAARSMYSKNGETSIDVRSKNADGDTALHVAALWGDVSVVDRLLQAGAFVNEPGAGGRTALYYAALEGHQAVAERLLAAGADPDQIVDIGMSSRDVASQRKDERLLELFEV
jgi:ankyrin repeat protein